MGWTEYADVCIPNTGQFLTSAILFWRPNNSSQWQDANHCTMNAAMNYAHTGNPSAQDRILLQNCQWKVNSDCGDEKAQPYVPNNGSAGLHVYHVAIFTDFCSNPLHKGHAALALFHGSAPEEHTTYEKWQKFQYGDLNIQTGSVCGVDQIPKPPNNSVPRTKVVFSEVTGYANCNSLTHGPAIVTFYLDENGNPSLNEYG